MKCGTHSIIEARVELILGKDVEVQSSATEQNRRLQHGKSLVQSRATCHHCQPDGLSSGHFEHLGRRFIRHIPAEQHNTDDLVSL